MTENKAQNVVLQLTQAGFNISTDAYEFLLKIDDPEKIANAILEKIKLMKQRPAIITHEVIESAVITYRAPVLQGEDWDFKKADTQYMVHGLHPYPARMIPQIAQRLVKRYSQPDDLILDPFCGAGTVSSECRLRKRNCIGIDINPLAVLLAKVKSIQVDRHRLHKQIGPLLKKVKEDIDRSRKGKIRVTVPCFADTNIEHWFKDYVINELSTILQRVQGIEDANVRDFFRLCFSLTMFKVSNIARSIQDSYLKALPKDKVRKYKPNVHVTFRNIVIESMKRISKFSEACSPSKGNWTQVFLGDAKKLPLASGNIDLIVTSPPYGEEKNTTAYMRWAKLVLFWFGYTPVTIRKLQKGTLGSKIAPLRTTSSETLNKTIDEIAKKDLRRAKDVASFCLDFFKCLEEMHRVLRKDCCCCIVIGNRSARGIRVPMDAITKEFGRDVGFEHVRTYHRRIPLKVQPHRDYKVEMINRENVIILKK